MLRRSSLFALLAVSSLVACGSTSVPPTVAAPTAHMPSTPLPPGCDSPEYHRLDFWIGSWDVTDAKGSYDGTNVIERGAGGCTLEERWVDAAGWRASSIFYFDRALRIWKQVWVTQSGEVKEKREELGAVAGAVRFRGDVALPNGGVAIDRTTLTPLADGHVKQRIERSSDGGATWEPWEGTYERLPQTCATPDHRRFDFWIGDWNVRIKTRKTPESEEWVETRGSNRVTSTLNGCAIREDFTGEGPPSSWTGKSLSMWQPLEKRWRQTWGDDSGSYIALIGNFENGEMTLVGETKPSGRTMRMVYTDISAAHLLWRWEGSNDGKTWRPMMIIDYVRAH